MVQPNAAATLADARPGRDDDDQRGDQELQAQAFLPGWAFAIERATTGRLEQDCSRADQAKAAA
jgi:hypothetical protein